MRARLGADDRRLCPRRLRTRPVRRVTSSAGNGVRDLDGHLETLARFRRASEQPILDVSGLVIKPDHQFERGPRGGQTAGNRQPFAITL